MQENNTVEDRRLHDLMRRSDALNAAVAAVEDWGLSAEARDETLEVLRQMAAEASRDFKEHMQIRLERLWSPECAEDAPCALWGETFTLGVVIARAVTKFRQDGGEVCPVCALYLAAGPMGRARPEAFPNLEEFARRLDEWEGPVYASDREFWEDHT